jgi:endo-1,4-beta-xylanase
MNDAPAQSRSSRRIRSRLFIGTAIAAALVALVPGTAHAEADRTITANSTGSHNGFFYSYWKDSGNVGRRRQLPGLLEWHQQHRGR